MRQRESEKESTETKRDRQRQRVERETIVERGQLERSKNPNNNAVITSFALGADEYMKIIASI